MGQYLIDTNVLSRYLTEDYSDAALDFLDEIVNSGLIISVITQIESLSWKTGAKIEKVVKAFVADSNVIDLSPEVVDVCIELRRKYKFKTPDAIIAATALTHNYTLITGNEKDFKNIKGLKIVNPHKL